MRLISKSIANNRHDLLAVKIAGHINRIHVVVAGKLSQWFNTLTPAIQKLLLIFIIIMAAISLLSGMIFPARPGSQYTAKMATSISIRYDLSLKSFYKHKN